MLNNKKDNDTSIFNRIMSFFFGVFFIILVMGITFSVIIDGFMEERVLGAKEAMLNEAINTCEYILRENSDILLSLTEDETVRYILREYDKMSFMDRFKAEKEMTQISDSFTIMRPEIAQIKIFKENVKKDITIHDSIYDADYLRNDEIYKKVTNLRAAFIPEYTLTNDGSKNEGRMSITSQIIDYNGEVLGYMCVEIDKSVIYKRCVSDTLLLNKYIVDETGKPIITPGNDHKVLYDDLVKLFNKTSKFTYGNIQIDGEGYVVLGSASSGHGWKIINIEKKTDFYSWRGVFISVILFIFLVIIFVFVWVANRLSLSILKPIVALSKSMEESQRAKESREFREIKILQKRYNSLLDSQREHIKEIEEYSLKEREAEIKSMVAQINPHFVFNTLNSIAYKALEEEQGELCTMIGKLGKLCKISYNLQSFLTTVEEEIMYVSLYMDLQNMCFGNKFTYEISVEDEVSKANMPRFILQPFVENSIVHGFENIKYDGQIRIKGFIENGNLIININDNGEGIEQEIIDKLNQNKYKTEKYGVRNVRQRIEKICGMEYGVEYKNHSRKGTSVVITLPGKGDEYAYSSYN